MKNYKKLKKVLWIGLFFVLVSLLKNLVDLPDNQNIKKGDPFLPQLVYNQKAKKETLSLLKYVPATYETGHFRMQIKLFGFIPFRHIAVNVVEPAQVMVGGNSIGVSLHTEGVMVVSHTQVQDANGRKHNPAAGAGILPGDLILKINGQPVQSDKQLQDDIDFIGRKGIPVALAIKRDKRSFNVTVNPVLCKETGRYRIGLLVRDSTAGMGTLTFYDPKTNFYGALGHIVTDVSTAKKIDLTDGQITSATVQDISPGQKGKPGEKIGMYQKSSGLSGDIKKNTPFGIFGQLKNLPSSLYYKDPLPAAMTYEIREGPAEVLTVLKGEKIESFTIEIEKVIPRVREDGKGLVIRVTDPKLISQTGGIVQGMSGSPIVQNGKFVGAVTHVLVNDPTRGFGVPAEWMLHEAGFFAFGDWGNRAA